jgi:hypothetical protein
MKTSRSLSRTEEGLREKSLGSGNEVAPGGVGSIAKKRGNERPNWRGRGLAKPQSMMLYPHVNQHLIVRIEEARWSACEEYVPFDIVLVVNDDILSTQVFV